MKHDWIPSTLGHGETMCRLCKATNREADALGMHECPGDSGAERYTCTECKRDMVNVGGPNPVPGMCLACQNMPGWFYVPELRKAFHMDDDGPVGTWH